MKKREYIFNETSWALMLGVYWASTALSGFIINYIHKTITLPPLLIISFILLIPVLITRIIAFSKTTIILSDNEIQVKRSSMIGIPIKADFRLHYSQIREYAFQDDMYWYWLKLIDKNGKTYRIWKFYTFNNTQYKNFRDRLNNEFIWYNQEIISTSNNESKSDTTIEVAPNIYQTKSGMALGIFSVVFLLVMLLQSGQAVRRGSFQASNIRTKLLTTQLPLHNLSPHFRYIGCYFKHHYRHHTHPKHIPINVYTFFKSKKRGW